jgi:hypothetical protein
MPQAARSSQTPQKAVAITQRFHQLSVPYRTPCGWGSPTAVQRAKAGVILIK